MANTLTLEIFGLSAGHGARDRTISRPHVSSRQRPRTCPTHRRRGRADPKGRNRACLISVWQPQLEAGSLAGGSAQVRVPE